jgi:crotonobetainyl-CoA:carnitine CoA-transferase CaiB-like acyl-CoA transferase
MSEPRLLTGIRVADGSGGSGPAAACIQILTQLGAHVVTWEARGQQGGADIWVHGEGAQRSGLWDMPPRDDGAPSVVVAVSLDPGEAAGSLQARRCIAGADLDHHALLLLTGAHAAVAAFAALRWARRAQATAHVSVTSLEVLASCLGETLHPALCPRHGGESQRRASRVAVVACADGWVGVAAPTPVHRELLARLTGAPAAADPNTDLAASLRPWCADRTRAEICDEAQLWQLPVVPVLAPTEVLDVDARSPFRIASVGTAGQPRTQPTSAYEAQHAPLGDVRVLDLGMVWAGPYCGRLLAALGASVVKIEGPRHPDGTRLTPGGCAGMFADLNQGKASLAVDLGAPEGRDAFLRLAADADVVVENFSPRVMPNFGLTPPVLAAINPALVSLALPAFGSTGPWASYVAYGSGLELATGLAVMDDAGFPAPAPVPYVDYLAGTYGAAAVLAALLARDANGTGCHIEVVQREVACQVLAIGARSLHADHQRAPSSLRGNGEEGNSAAVILSAAKDSSSQRRGHGSFAALRMTMGTRPYGDVDAAALVAEPSLVASGLFAAPADEGAMCVHFARPPWSIDALPPLAMQPAPALGADGRAMLRAAGLSDMAINKLVAGGVVKEAPPEPQ